MTKEQIAFANARLLYRGAWLSTYSPGDGVRRYRLLDVREWCKRHDCTEMDIEDGLAAPPDYFGGVAIVTALGSHEAKVMVDAYIEGWDAGRQA